MEKDGPQMTAHHEKMREYGTPVEVHRKKMAAYRPQMKEYHEKMTEYGLPMAAYHALAARRRF